jgi:hypothetical protein
MNHWFLVGRDVMWIVVVYTPVVFAFCAGHGLGEADDPGNAGGACITMWVALILQPFLIAAAYFLGEGGGHL